MPATEQAWRDQKLLHVVFGCTSVVMLISTLWMLGADHSVEWKGYQRKMRHMEERLTGWRQSQEADATRTENERLNAELLDARAELPSSELYNRFKQRVQEDASRRQEKEHDFSSLDSDYTQLSQLSASVSSEPDKLAAVKVRERVLGELRAILRRARFREDRLLGERKFKAADYDAARADLDLAVRDGKSEIVQAQLQVGVDALKEQLDQLTQEYQDAADHRADLRDILDKITLRQDELAKAIEDTRAEYIRLETSLAERKATYFTSSFPFLGKKILELPVLDAFNSPLKVDNLWTENLTIENGSFGKVRRFDRCTTCHKSINKTMPGSAIEPAFVVASEVDLMLATPDAEPQVGDAASNTDDTLEVVYGIGLAQQGLIDNDDVTVDRVLANSLAAVAVAGSAENKGEEGLRVGDVILYVNGDKVLSNADFKRRLLETANWGTPLTVTVRRGLPHPYTSHPRLDLFVGSLSPHKLSDMACTICHDGQGSATTFKWASHSPNSPDEARRWSMEHGWFNNHHWIFPMFPQRFTESACLKCHHDVVELEPSDRFPDPPAPKLIQGYNLIRRFGCYGCHEINGYSGPDERIGPDLRLEPNYFAAAARIKADKAFGQLEDEPKDWVDQLMRHPERGDVRHRLLEFVRQDADSDNPLLSADSHKMIGQLEDVESPGQLRRVGPSLRYIKQKLGPEFLYDWIRNPQHFRPSTRMPRFFGLWDHLQHDNGANLERTKQYEAIEVLGIVSYLLDKSQSWEYQSREEGIDPSSREEQLQRGKLLFETRGCLACHQHGDFPGHEAIHGPDLTNIGGKFSAPETPDGRAWLYSWLKDPTNYHSRSKMPNLLLEPITDASGTVTDPAADIVEYLMSSTRDWKPAEDVAAALTPNTEALDELALEHLSEAFFKADAESYLQSGIPEELRDSLKGLEVELVGAIDQRKKLNYVGAKTIVKFGCHGCHDIPGFEDAKPIGTALADWGRKEPSKLAFEHIVEYLHGHGHGHGNHDSESDGTEGESDIDEAYYMQKLHENDRIGFIWQKLKEPRSYDYKKTANKRHNERLRMPQFPFNDREREAVVTFVLGLVADPPSTEFVYHATPRAKALIEGTHVLEKYNCGGCHILEPEKWEIEFEPGEIVGATVGKMFPFVSPYAPANELLASKELDPQRGVLRATISGMPAVSDEDGRPSILDEEFDPIEEGVEYDPNSLQYRFDLWKPTIIDGEPYPVGVLAMTIPATSIKKKYPAVGGDLTRALFTRAVELEKQVNPVAKGTEAWGWLPPPLIGEGNKVQPGWLHSFLSDPHEIRPAVLMRMPRFNMSPDDASKLVSYFAAKDSPVFPFDFDNLGRGSYLAAQEQAYRQRIGNEGETNASSGHLRLDHAMQIVTDSNYCIKCHRVGDFEPAGSDRAKAPDLSQVFLRLRPDFVRQWIANPKSVLPYTPMPVNVPYDPDAPNLGGVSQDLYRGTSIEQVNALVDLLMNYDQYTSGRSQIAPLVKAAGPSVGAENASTAGSGD